MRVARFDVECIATYKGELEIPESVHDGEELDYIRENIKYVPRTNLRWVSNKDPFDAVTEESVRILEYMD